MKPRPPRSALPLPRYVRRKAWGGRWFYFFDVPTWARRRGCSVENEPLGSDYAEAVQRAELVLLPAFDSWRTGGSDGKPGVGAIKGTIDWMFDEFRKTWKEVTAKRPRPLSPGQCRVHETGIGMIADYVLQVVSASARGASPASTPHSLTACSRNCSTKR